MLWNLKLSEFSVQKRRKFNPFYKVQPSYQLKNKQKIVYLYLWALNLKPILIKTF